MNERNKLWSEIKNSSIILNWTKYVLKFFMLDTYNICIVYLYCIMLIFSNKINFNPLAYMVY